MVEFSDTQLQTISVDEISNYISYISQTLTNKMVEFLANNGFIVSERWAGMFLVFVSLGIIFIGLKISKPFVKWGLIILGILLLGGFIFPW